MNILADASLPGLQAAFPAPFCLKTYQSAAEIPDLLMGQEVLLCRSTLRVDTQLLAKQKLKFVATASSGTDHIDKLCLEQHNIKLIDAKGSNASSVADYVCACLAYLHNPGKRAGIIGMGEVGTQVHARLHELGYSIVSFDPLKPDYQSCAVQELFDCDLLCIHAELHDNLPYPSRGLVNVEFLAQLKPNCVIINAARGGIVDEEALLSLAKPLVYCTDVYLNEPKINPAIVEKAELCTPHIAGHSLEAKYLAVAQVSQQLHEMLGLPLPCFEKPVFASAGIKKSILEIYNPLHETLLLKQAKNIQETFLTVRKNHLRHDFGKYTKP